MKKTTLISMSLLSAAISGAVAADPPAKERLFHCGCNYNGTGLEWVGLNVSKKAKGHGNHQAGDSEACYNRYSYQWVEYIRGWDDCEEEYGPNIYGVGDCDYVSESGNYFGTDYTSFRVGDSCDLGFD